MIKLLLALSTAHAGWFGRLCMSKLVMNDPYQHEQNDIHFVIRKLSALCIKKRWRSLTREEQEDFDILSGELSRRRAYGPDAERDLADIALIECSE